MEIAVRRTTADRLGSLRSTLAAVAAAVPGLAAALTPGVGAAAALTLAAGSASAVQPADERTDAETLADFIHYVFIARYDIAAGLADELIGSGMTPVGLVDLVEGSGEADRFRQALARAVRVDELEEVAATLDAMFRDGKLAKARDPEEVAKNIELLKGTFQQRFFGRERLVAAGEYALPQLLQAYLQVEDPALRVEVRKVLIDLGRQSIVPLVTALPSLTPDQQILVVDVLSNIQYRTSLPYLVDLYTSTNLPSLRQAVARAVERLGGDVNAPVAGLYASLSEAYYDERVELTSFFGEEHQLLWSYDPGLGLIMTAIRTEVFHEAMAMRTIEEAISADPGDPELVARWIAANFSREIDTPEGYDNPAYGSDRREAKYFAVAAGPGVSSRVLGMAVDDGDTPLARRAIAAIERTAGVNTLIDATVDGSAPILEALGYPSRRVQYDAALALAAAQPEAYFPGSERVVPTLASMVREADARYAIVLTGPDSEEYDRLRTVLEGEGYVVLPPAPGGLGDIAAPIADAPGIDLVVISRPASRVVQLIDQARADTRLAVAPILALTMPDELPGLRRQFERDATVMTRRATLAQDEIRAATAELVEAATGGVISDEEAGAYAARALAALRDLALARGGALDVADAAVPLMASLGESVGRTRLDVAEVLAHIGEARTQRAIAEAALDASGNEQLAMLEKLGESAKRFGNLLETRHTRRLLILAQESADNELATAAAAVVGALAVPNDRLIPLILGGEAEGGGGGVVRDGR